ncbi:MAG TPA: TonB-dependent receptor [Gemmatimonadaceae bacterium]|nr:TonB-dependent receptor [Gemmatimonadaceae bacterium]
MSGVVTDASTGAPIEGAQVVVSGTGYGALSQANGRYFIVGVPPGVYTITARRVGYAAQEVSGVNVAIDVTRELNFSLSTSTILETQRIVAEATPLVERGITGSSTTITAEAIQTLPVTSIAGVLALQQGFVDVPQNTQLVALAEEQRSTIAPIRVRGGRGGATVTLVDGFPVNNPVFGTAAINLNPFAVSAIDFVRGYMEPQYGNGLSGVINQATREGGTEVAGSVDYQTTAVAGALGSDADELKGQHLVRGFLAGSVPGTSSRLRYAISGEIETGAHRVLEFDDEVFSWNNPSTFDGLPPDQLDLRPGWQAFGGTQNRQFVGKLTFLPSVSTKINLLGIDQERQSLPYDRRYLLVAIGDPWKLANNVMDSLGLITQRNFQDILQSSVRDETQMFGAVLEQRFGRTLLQVRGARTDFERNTCNILLGACVPRPFTLPNFREQFIAPFGVPGIPFPGGAGVYGGEAYTSYMGRADLQSQVSDHHNLQFGASYLRHDIEYAEFRAQPGQSGVAASIPQLYRAKPIEFATYAQDRVEYDFLTVKLGFRFDYGQARGRGFRDPLNPTAGTTAREVCAGEAPSVGATAPYTFVDDQGTPDPSDDVQLTGVAACLASTPNAQQKPFLLDSATRIAALDDFAEAKARRAFSPRIGISFPLTERSAVFFNAGRYTMNPLYGNLYRNSGVGTVAGSEASGGDGFCDAAAVKPGTNECYPPLTPGNPEFVGNPNLLLEQATQYEVGYGAEFGRFFSINVAVYNRDETGLSGLVSSRPVQDIGATYSGQSNPAYFTIVNQDFLTARGIEVQFRRRLANFWSFDVNYGWSRATSNSPPPERSFEIAQSGELDRSKLREITSDIDQTHRFNTTFSFRVREQTPDFWGGRFLRNSAATLTYRYSSGFPYTPVAAFTLGGITNQGNARDVNAARMPSTQQVNLLVQKNFSLTNVSYGAFVRVDNLFDRKNCVQVFVNTGTCDNGLRDPLNRRVGNFGTALSTSLDQPEYIGARRSISTGIQVNF